MSTRRTTIGLDVRELARADAGTIDALARLQLSLRRIGFNLQLRHPSRELVELLALAGLCDALGVEPGRQSETREQGRRFEEERELGDLPS